MIENKSILELVGYRKEGGMNNNSVRLSDSKIIMTVQNILKETLYPLFQGARTT